MPLLGIRLAHAGALGLTAGVAIVIAVAKPLAVGLALILVAAAGVLVFADLYSSRGPSDIRQR